MHHLHSDRASVGVESEKEYFYTRNGIKKIQRIFDFFGIYNHDPRLYYLYYREGRITKSLIRFFALALFEILAKFLSYFNVRPTGVFVIGLPHTGTTYIAERIAKVSNIKYFKPEMNAWYDSSYFDLGKPTPVEHWIEKKTDRSLHAPLLRARLFLLNKMGYSLFKCPTATYQIISTPDLFDMTIVVSIRDSKSHIRSITKHLPSQWEVDQLAKRLVDRVSYIQGSVPVSQADIKFLLIDDIEEQISRSQNLLLQKIEKNDQLIVVNYDNIGMEGVPVFDNVTYNRTKNEKVPDFSCRNI